MTDHRNSAEFNFYYDLSGLYNTRFVEFKNVHIVNSIGANVAFWNVKNYKVSKTNNVVYEDDSPLIFYHFSSVVILGSREFDLCSFYHIDDKSLMDYIYDPYVRCFSQTIESVIKEFPWFNAGFIDRSNIINLHNYKI